MKTNSFIILAILSITFFSCKKDKNTTSAPAVTCQLTQKVETQGGYSDTSKYTYNSAKKVVKIISGNSYRMDTIIYNTAGKISAVNSYQNSTLYSSIVYNYTGSILTSSVKTRSVYTTTTNFTYTGSVLTAITMTTNDPQEQAMSIIDLVWSNGNVISGTIDFGGGALWEVVITSDGKNNISRFDYPNTGGDFIDFFNKNNIISVSLVNQETDGVNTFPAGSKLVDNTFTYTSNNEISTINSQASIFNTQTSTTTCTYSCQ